MQNRNSQVWYTPFPKDSMNVAPVTYRHPDRDIHVRQASLLGNPTEPWPQDVPLPVLTMEYTDPLGPTAYNLPDMFLARSAIIVSEKVRDILSGFDMGKNEILEVPLVEQNGQVPMPGRWFALRVMERKDGIDTDRSDTGTQKWMKPASGDNALILRTLKTGRKSWLLNADHGSSAPKGVAVKSSAAQGADLWIDPLIRTSIIQAFFATDRLHDALTAGKLKVKSLHFAPAIMTDEGV